MKLGLMAYQMAKDWDIPTTAKMCREGGMASFEFFAHPEYRQNIRLEMTASERHAARKAFENEGVAIAGLAIAERYDWLEPAKVREAVAKTREWIALAVDLGAPRLRCLGDKLHEDAEPKEKTIARVAGALSELLPDAEKAGVDLGLEMHGQYTPWENALAVVKKVGHPRCYLVHNSQPENTPPEDFDRVFELLWPHLGHVHFHDLLDEKFPYARFIRKLEASGYRGYCSLEIRQSQDPVRVMHLTKGLFEAYRKAGKQ